MAAPARRLSAHTATTHDPAIADLVTRWRADFAALSPAEQLASGNWMEQGIHIIGNFDKHSGTVPRAMADLSLATHNLLLDHMRHPGARTWWAQARPRGRFMPNTVRGIEAILEDGRHPIGPHL